MARVVALAYDMDGCYIYANSNIDPTQDPQEYDYSEDGWETVWDEVEYTKKTFGEDDDKIEAWQSGDDESREDLINQTVLDAQPDFVYDPEDVGFNDPKPMLRSIEDFTSRT